MDPFWYLCFVSVISVHYSLMVTCWERANLLAFLYVMFSCVCVTFPFGVQGGTLLYRLLLFVFRLTFMCFSLAYNDDIPWHNSNDFSVQKNASVYYVN